MIPRTLPKAHYHSNIMLRPEPEGGAGRTVDEAREMARDAISGSIASLRKHKEPVPTVDETRIASLDPR